MARNGRVYEIQLKIVCGEPHIEIALEWNGLMFTLYTLSHTHNKSNAFFFQIKKLLIDSIFDIGTMLLSYDRRKAQFIDMALVQIVILQNTLNKARTKQQQCFRM